MKVQEQEPNLGGLFVAEAGLGQQLQTRPDITAKAVNRVSYAVIWYAA
jgi:hypothetical protein